MTIGFRLALCLAMLFAACAHRQLDAADLEGPFKWGRLDDVTHLSRLWFGGQPDGPALNAAKEAGVSVVINLRARKEFHWNERKSVESRGMTYYRVAVIVGQPLDRAAFERVEQLVHDHPGEQVFIHGNSSNRAGAWLATHMVEKHGLTAEQGLEVGRRAGVTKRGLEKAIREYLDAPTP